MESKKTETTLVCFNDGALEMSISQERARKTMSRGLYWGVEEWQNYFGYPFTEAQLKMIERIPFPGVLLERARNTHFLHLGVCPPVDSGAIYKPLTAIRWLDLPESVRPRWINISDAIREEGIISSQSTGLRWHLTRIIPSRKPRSPSYSDISLDTDALNSLPCVIETVQMLMFYEILNGNKPNLNGAIVTRDQLKDGRTVCVGYLKFDYFENGLEIQEPLAILLRKDDKAPLDGPPVLKLDIK